MKKIFILLSLILLFTSCYDSTKNPTLVEVDKMIDCNPDSAYSILTRIAKDTASYSTTNQMYFKLLLAEAMNKKKISMAKITDMNQVLKYYSANGKENERIQANYMMGCVYRDRGNSPEAISYFNHAVLIPDTTKRNCNFQLVSRIYGQMADIYMQQQQLSMEVNMRKIEASLALKAKDTINYLSCKERMVHIYYDRGEFDKVKEISLESYSFYKKMGRKDLAAAGLMPLTDYYLRKKQYLKAKALIDEYRELSTLIDKKGNPLAPGAEYAYNYLGRYYEATGKIDSALFYYHKFLNFSNDIEDIKVGYKGLISSYYRLEDIDSIVKYSKLYADTNDTINIRHSVQEASNAQVLYNYANYLQKTEENSTQNSHLWKMLLWALFFISVLAIIVYFWRKNNLKGKLELLLQYQKKEEELTSIKENTKKKEQDLQQENAYLKSVIKTYQQHLMQEELDAKKGLMGSCIVMKFLNYQTTGFRPSEIDWVQLDTVFMKLQPVFHKKMTEYKNKKSLTSDQYRLCLLTKISLTSNDIAILIGTSTQQISNIRGNVNEKLFNHKGTSKFEFYIKNL